MNITPRRAALAAGITAALIALGCGANPKGPGVPAPAGPPPATRPSAAPSPTGPLTMFGDGVRLVGTAPGNVTPGTYTTTVPAGSYGCYWARLRGTGGELSEIIANGNQNAGAAVTVTVTATDKAFQVEGCGTWKRSA